MKQLSIIICLIFLGVSCAPKESTKVTTTLSIGSGIVNGIGQDGGLMLYGRNLNTGESFAKQFDGAEMDLPNGTWQFIVVGWDGDDDGNPTVDSGNVGMYKMVGDVDCGHVPAVLLNGGDVNIPIQLNTSNCQDPVFGAPDSKETSGNIGSPKRTTLYTCFGVEGVVFADDVSCKRSVALSYRVVMATKPLGGAPNVNGGLESACIDAPSASPNSNREMGAYTSDYVRVPMFLGDTSIPMAIKSYDANGCVGTPKIHLLENGVDNGIPSKVSYNSDAAHNNFFVNHDPCFAGFLTSSSGTPFNVTQGLNVQGSNEDVRVICNQNQLSDINTNPADNYILKRDIDFQNIQIPAPGIANTFTGRLYGRNHVIKNLTIGSIATQVAPEIGFFRRLEGAEIRGIKFKNITVEALDDDNVGMLAGRINDSPGVETVIENMIFEDITINADAGTGPMTGIGGIIGDSTKVAGYHTKMERIYMDNITINLINSTGRDYTNVGGLIGFSPYVSGASLDISEIFVDGMHIYRDPSSNSASAVGGLVGTFDTGSMRDVYVKNLAMGTSGVRLGGTGAFDHIGGLVGKAFESQIENSKVEGKIFANAGRVGGIIGEAQNTRLDSLVADFNEIGHKLDNTKPGTGGIVGMITAPSDSVSHVRSFGEINCDDNCGGVVGETAIMTGLDINRVYSKATINDTSATGFAGGIIGRMAAGTVGMILRDSFFDGDIQGYNVGGIVGYYAEGATINKMENVYALGSLDGFDVGGIVATAAGIGTATICDGCISDVDITFSNSKNAFKANQVGGNSEFDNSVFNTDNPSTGVTGSPANPVGIANGSWNFAAISSAHSGYFTNPPWVTSTNDVIHLKDYEDVREIGAESLGNRMDPYEIYTAAQWNSIGAKPAFMGSSIKLMDDISFGAGNFTPIGNLFNCFYGNLLGNDKTLSDITETFSGGNPAGVIRTVCVPELVNFTSVANPGFFPPGTMIKQVAGFNYFGMVLENDGTNIVALVTSSASFPAGASSFEDFGSVNSSTYATAGVLGTVPGAGVHHQDPINLELDYSLYLDNVNITSDGYVGALVGYAFDRIDSSGSNSPVGFTNVHVTNSVIVQTNIQNPTGGVFGGLQLGQDSIFANISFDGNVVGNSGAGSYAGGIVGNITQDPGCPTNCYDFRFDFVNNYGTVDGNGADYAGGIIGGLNYDDVSNSPALYLLGNYGTIYGAGTSGGVIGKFNSSAKVAESLSIGNVDATNFAGGFVGEASMSTNAGTIEASYARAAVSATTQVGGFVGTLGASADNFTDLYSDPLSLTATTVYGWGPNGTSTNTNILYTNLDAGDESLTNGTYLTLLDILDPVNTSVLNVTNSSFIIMDGAPPALWFELFPEYIDSED